MSAADASTASSSSTHCSPSSRRGDITPRRRHLTIDRQVEGGRKRSQGASQEMLRSIKFGHMANPPDLRTPARTQSVARVPKRVVVGTPRRMHFHEILAHIAREEIRAGLRKR